MFLVQKRELCLCCCACREGEKRVFEEEGFGLRNGEIEGEERMVSMAELQRLKMEGEFKKKRRKTWISFCFSLSLLSVCLRGWLVFSCFFDWLSEF